MAAQQAQHAQHALPSPWRSEPPPATLATTSTLHQPLQQQQQVMGPPLPPALSPRRAPSHPQGPHSLPRYTEPWAHSPRHSMEQGLLQPGPLPLSPRRTLSHPQVRQHSPDSRHTEPSSSPPHSPRHSHAAEQEPDARSEHPQQRPHSGPPPYAVPSQQQWAAPHGPRHTAAAGAGLVGGQQGVVAPHSPRPAHSGFEGGEQAMISPRPQQAPHVPFFSSQPTSSLGNYGPWVSEPQRIGSPHALSSEQAGQRSSWAIHTGGAVQAPREDRQWSLTSAWAYAAGTGVQMAPPQAQRAQQPPLSLERLMQQQAQHAQQQQHVEKRRRQQARAEALASLGPCQHPAPSTSSLQHTAGWVEQEGHWVMGSRSGGAVAALTGFVSLAPLSSHGQCTVLYCVRTKNYLVMG